jgi:hypothetical protein
MCEADPNGLKLSCTGDDDDLRNGGRRIWPDKYTSRLGWDSQRGSDVETLPKSDEYV